MAKTLTITKVTAIALNLTGAKPSRSVKVGPNTLYQPATGRIAAGNNINTLCYHEKIGK